MGDPGKVVQLHQNSVHVMQAVILSSKVIVSTTELFFSVLANYVEISLSITGMVTINSER